MANTCSYPFSKSSDIPAEAPKPLLTISQAHRPVAAQVESPARDGPAAATQAAELLCWKNETFIGEVVRPFLQWCAFAVSCKGKGQPAVSAQNDAGLVVLLPRGGDGPDHWRFRR